MNTELPSFALLPEHDDGTLLVRDLRAYFTEARTRAIIIPLISKSSPVSLRMLDWLVVNMAKGSTIVCPKENGTGTCNIHSDYKVTLSVFKRAAFDPFRRYNRSTIVIDGETHVTTLGQVHFIYWAARNGILQYANNNCKAIEDHMSNFATRHRARLKEAKRLGIKRKRSTLTPVAASGVSVYFVPTCTNLNIYDDVET